MQGFIMENLQIIATLGSALALFIFLRNSARGDLAHVDKKLDTKIDNLEKRMDERFAAVDQRFNMMDKRMDGLDKRIDGVDKRIDSLTQRMENGFDQSRQEMHNLRIELLFRSGDGCESRVIEKKKKTAS